MTDHHESEPKADVRSGPEERPTQTHCPCGARLIGKPKERRVYFDDGLERCNAICDGVNYDD